MFDSLIQDLVDWWAGSGGATNQVPSTTVYTPSAPHTYSELINWTPADLARNDITKENDYGRSNYDYWLKGINLPETAPSVGNAVSTLGLKLTGVNWMLVAAIGVAAIYLIRER